MGLTTPGIRPSPQCFRLVEQNASKALAAAHHGYILESGRIVMDDTCDELLKNEDVQEFYLGMRADETPPPATNATSARNAGGSSSPVAFRRPPADHRTSSS